MLKCVQRLLNSSSDLNIGNHAVFFLHAKRRKFKYYQTTICDANDNDKTIIINNGGWDTSSTNRAINDYIKYFVDLGYTVIDNRR